MTQTAVLEELTVRTEKKRIDDVRRQLAAASKSLLPDYQAGGELTIFTALDSEDFYA